MIDRWVLWRAGCDREIHRDGYEKELLRAGCDGEPLRAECDGAILRLGVINGCDGEILAY